VDIAVKYAPRALLAAEEITGLPKKAKRLEIGKNSHNVNKNLL